jgi:hypothetical protein
MARSDCGGNGDGGGHCVQDDGDCINDMMTFTSECQLLKYFLQ